MLELDARGTGNARCQAGNSHHGITQRRRRADAIGVVGEMSRPGPAARRENTRSRFDSSSASAGAAFQIPIERVYEFPHVSSQQVLHLHLAKTERCKLFDNRPHSLLVTGQLEVVP